MNPPLEAIEEAKKYPNGVVYCIDGDFGDGAVPPDKIIGAWKTNANGEIVGDLIRNPNYRSQRAKKHWWQFWKPNIQVPRWKAASNSEEKPD